MAKLVPIAGAVTRTSRVLGAPAGGFDEAAFAALAEGDRRTYRALKKP